LLVFGSQQAVAQALPKEAAGYGSGVATMLGAAGNPQARAYGHKFDSVWQAGGFTSEQQGRIMTLSGQMEQKRYKPTPHFSAYFGMLAGAAGKGNSVNEVLEISERLFKEGDSRNFTRFMEVSAQFLKNRALYHSNYSRLYASGGSFSFRWVQAEQPKTQPVEAPKEDASYFDDWDAPAEKADESWSTAWDAADGTAQDSKKDPKKAKAPVAPTPVYIQQELPLVEGPVISLSGVTLSLVSNQDSVLLSSTKGDLMMLKELFVGEGGRFTWENAGLSPDAVYADFAKYSIKTNRAEVTADEVKLTYKEKLSAPVEGVFEYKSTRYARPDQAQYPRFKSYESNIKVKGVSENLLYRGGFALAGNKIYSSSLNGGLASIELQQAGKQRFIIRSLRFNLQDTVIRADRSAVVIYHQKDSIYHPAVQSRYNTSTGMLTLIKDGGAFKYTPFVSSFFQMDITADIMQWNTNADSINISILSGKSQVPAYFSSQEYFHPQRFDELKGIYNFHPLLMAVGYARKHQRSEFYSDDMAKELKQDRATVRNSMKMLMQNGYIDYDLATGWVKINRKGFHYVMSQSRKKDFDNLMIPSLEAAQANATLYLNKQELKVRGIKQFYISRQKNVYIEPTKQEITLLQNRDFRFDGKVQAGSFIFEGKQMRFDYDSFLIDLPKIESIQFDVDDYKDKKDLRKKRLDNALAETAGKLYIDLPTNKSSMRDFPHYPVFDASTGSTVFFDRKEVAGGAYSKKMSFTIPPFNIDSLSSSNPSTIAFRGMFSSGGIVPDFEETITVLPDNSLGFQHLIPREGYALYGGSAVLYDTLVMDQKGLHGKGHFTYLTSTLYSRDFYLFEDSVKADGYKMEMKQGTLAGANFPQASVGQYKMKWLPKQDSLFVYNQKKPFELFDGIAQLEGNLLIRQKGLYGGGKLLSKGAELESKDYTFQQRDFLAENADFKINSNNPKKPILAAKDVQINYDLDRGTATISPEVEGVAALDFPFAEYRTSIPQAVWNFEEKTVVMSKPKNIDIKSSYFYTTRKELDSLAFNAEGAVYDIAALKLNVSGIPFIRVADAKITPENNKVEILEGARLQDFTNATIVMDTLNEYHNLINGQIKILSRNKFEGKATYRLVTSASDTFNIQFNSFQLVEVAENRRRKAFRTLSSGYVKEEEKMMISPGMTYRGKVTMFSHKPALELDGAVKLDLKKIPNYYTWIRYKSTGEQKEIAFNFNNSVTDDGQPLIAGIHYDTRTNELYPSFVTKKRAADDQDLFVPAGVLSYDGLNNEYRIEEIAKSSGKSYVGRIFAYNETSGEVRFEGPLTFLPNNKNSLQIKAAGLGKGSFQSSEFDMNTLMVFDYKLPLQAEGAMGTHISDVVQRTGLPQAHSERNSFIYKLAEVVGEGPVKSWENKSLQTYTPVLNVSSELAKSLVITDLNLKWSEQKKAWYSMGKIGLSNVGTKDINAVVDGFVEIRKSSEVGNIINVFLQIAPGEWYFLNFEGNRLLAYSSHDDFNTAIRNKSKAAKAKPGDYVIADSDLAETKLFVSRFRRDYFGLETPYDLNIPTPVPVTEDDPFATGTKDAKPSRQADDKDGF
jgi:hypothetical protein